MKKMSPKPSRNTNWNNDLCMLTKLPASPKALLLILASLTLISCQRSGSVAAFSISPSRLSSPSIRNTLLHAQAPSKYSDQPSPELQPAIKIINAYNPSLHESLTNLRTMPYFRYYSVDMLASCEYIPQELFECYSETCEIYPVDEYAEDGQTLNVPQKIRTLDVQEFDFDIDGWARWDMPSEDYYDIIEFQEEFTGYDGSEVWKFIHDRITFETEEASALQDSWKQDFNKAVSGMHSMISAHIVQGIQSKIDNGEEEDFADDCQWTNPKLEYIRRLSVKGQTPMAIENMYFTFMLLLSALQSSRDYLILTGANFGCDENDVECDLRVKQALDDVLSSPLLQNQNSASTFDSSSLQLGDLGLGFDGINVNLDIETINKYIGVASENLHDHAIREDQSKHNLWEARMRSRELLRIMNCVQCNKCRLHGKIAAMGLSTALQLLLGKSGDGIKNEQDFRKIHRVELAALMTTLAKFSNAIQFCMEMEERIMKEDE